MAKYKTKQDFWQSLKEQCLLEIAKIEVDMEIYSNLPEEEIIGQDTRGADPKDMTAAEGLEIKQQNLKVYSDRLSAIDRLLKR